MFCRTVSQGNSVYDWKTIPRSAPGALTGVPSSRMRPDVGASSPATIRNSVDLPQPDGPRIEMKSLSVTISVVGSSATVGAWPRPPGKVRLTAEMTSLLISDEAPAEQALVRPLEGEIGHEPDHADHDDAEDDLAGIEQRLAVGAHVTDPARRADEFGDDHVRPRPSEHQPQLLGDRGRGVRQQHPAHDTARVGAERVRRLDEIAPRAADGDGDHQHDLEERADEDHEHR